MRPNLYWMLCWGGIAPAVMGVIFLFYCFKWEPVKYGSVEYPNWAHGIGFLMSFSSMMWIPGYALYYLATNSGTLKDVSWVLEGRGQLSCLNWCWFVSREWWRGSLQISSLTGVSWPVRPLTSTWWTSPAQGWWRTRAPSSPPTLLTRPMSSPASLSLKISFQIYYSCHNTIIISTCSCGDNINI